MLVGLLLNFEQAEQNAGLKYSIGRWEDFAIAGSKVCYITDGVVHILLLYPTSANRLDVSGVYICKMLVVQLLEKPYFRYARPRVCWQHVERI